MDLHCKRCPQCISDILSLTADINSFRVKYFKPKKKSLFKKKGFKYCWHSYGFFKCPGYSQGGVSPLFFFFSPLFFFTFSHLCFHAHLSYASNLVWFASLSRNKTTVEVPQKYKWVFECHDFSCCLWNRCWDDQDSSSRMRQKWKHVFQDTRFTWMCNKLIWNTGIWFSFLLGFFFLLPPSSPAPSLSLPSPLS